MTALEVRRSLARQAYDDILEVSDEGAALEEAIEVATTVTISDGMIAEAYPWLLPSGYELARPRLANAFRAAGFEVTS